MGKALDRLREISIPREERNLKGKAWDQELNLERKLGWKEWLK